MELDVRHLRLIVAVADSLSVSGAARALGMAQPTASVQLQRIERSVGSRLFERTPDGVVVTEAGRALLWHARSVLRGVEGLLDDATSADPAATIRVASVNAGVERALAHVARRRPAAQWVMTSRTHAAGVAALLSGDVDLLVLARHESAPAPDLPDEIDSRFVLSARLQVTLPAAHPVAATLLVDLRDLADEGWVTAADPDAHDVVVRECRAAGVEPEVSCRVDDVGSVELLVETMGAVTVAPVWHDVRPGVIQRPYRGAGALVWYVLHLRAGADADLADDVVAGLLDAFGPTMVEHDVAGIGRAGIGSARRPLRVGAEHSPVIGAIPGALRDGYGLVTTVTLGGLAQLVAQIEDGRLDLVLVHDYPAAPGVPIPVGWPELTAVEVEPLWLAMSPTHPLAARAVVELAELHDQPWVLPGVQSERDRSAQLAILRSAGLTPWVVASWTHGQFLPGVLAALHAVALVGSVSPDEQLVLVRVADAAAGRRVAVAWRHNGDLDEPATRLARVYHDLVSGKS